ncbi:hypothetical protein LCGC14_0619490 [marine sediment metagenome]|uniref:Uncharacterized protein n=1 Tax=marine sediment metagenome TaxID=412755 RepID=A0A0F9RPP3_9ZZZZ
MIQYGGKRFKTLCHCGKECKMPQGLSVNEYMDRFNKTGISSVPGACPDHGETQLEEISSVPLPAELMIPA